MKLSIIIVSFNTKKLTLEAISSSLKEDLDLEVIVIDNASADGSVGAIEKTASSDKRLKLIKNRENLGFAKASNQGIKISRGEYIFLLNSDTIVREGALVKLINFAQKTPDAGVVGPKLLNADGTLQKSCYHFLTLGRAIKEYWFGQKGHFGQFAPKGRSPITVDALVGAAFLITPKALKKAGMLDERYFFYFEDIDYCRRVWDSGLKVYYYPLAEIIHLVGASGKKLADSKDQWRRLIPSSKVYHGPVGHYLLTAVIWLGQKWERIFKS